jgi:hypothetical protein
MIHSCSSGLLVIQVINIINIADKENKILKHNQITLHKEVSANNRNFEVSHPCYVFSCKCFFFTKISYTQYTKQNKRGSVFQLIKPLTGPYRVQ